MASERENMLGGELYNPYVADLSADRRTARDLTHAFNRTRDADKDEAPPSTRRIARDDR